MFLTPLSLAWLRGGGVQLQVSDGGAGGGAPDGGAPGAPEAQADAVVDDWGLPPAPAPSSAGADPDDVEDEDVLADSDDDVPAQETADQRANRIAKKLNKVKRRLARHLPVAKRLKGVNLDEVFYKSRQYDEMMELAEKNPAFRAIVRGEAPAGPAPGHPRDRAPADRPKFDRSKLPFDPETNDVHRWMAEVGEKVYSLEAENAALRERLEQHAGRYEQETQQRTELEEKKAWGAAINRVMPHVPERLRGILNDAMISAFKSRHEHKQTPQAILHHYVVKQFGLSPKGAAASAAKAKARQVATGHKWPQSQRGGGHPTAAKTSDGKIRLKDIEKRLRTGASAGG